MTTNQTKKLVVSVLLVIVTITTASAAHERYTQETADALLQAYYPHLAQSQRQVETHPAPTGPVEVVRAPAPEAAPAPQTIPAPQAKPVVRPSFLEEALEETEDEYGDDTEAAESAGSWKQMALAKTKAFVTKTKDVLSKPGAQAATLAVSIVAYSATKALKSALAQHSDKQGTDKLKAVFNSIKSAGLGKALLGTQKSLTQDPSLKQAFVGMAIDSVAELATGALARLAYSKVKTA